MQEGNVWIWREPDSRWKKEVLDMIRAVDPVDKDVILLHCSEVDGFDDSIPLANFILNLAQTFNVLKKERTMFLNPKDLSQAIELCLEKLSNKTEGKESKIKDEDILKCHKEYANHFKSEEDVGNAVLQLKKFIDENNCADLGFIQNLLQKYENQNDIKDHLSQKKILVLGTPQSDILREIILMLVPNGTIFNVIVETPLNVSLQGSPSSCSLAVEVVAEPMEAKDIPVDVEYQEKLGSATEEYVEDVLTSFLSLLVNSRNELALAKVMISPIVDLGHDAFTALKHLAEKKEMPMCQTVLSYVTRLKLGGKGYAPPSDCPLLPHIKSLELFVNTLNQMQMLIEEDLAPVSAVKRLINILKKKLLKSGGDRLRESAIEAAAENLKGTAVKVLDLMKSEKNKFSSPTQVCQENLNFLHYFVNYVNSSCLTFDPKRVLFKKLEKRTPLSLPPLLGYFRSPEEESSCDSKSMVDEDSIISNNSIVSQPPVSYFHYSENSSVSTSCVDTTTPSKTSFKGCLPMKNEDDDESPLELELFTAPKKSTMKKGRKRSILGEITNENPPIKGSKESKKPKIFEDETKRVEKKMKTVEKNTAKLSENKTTKPIKNTTNKSVKKTEANSKSKVSKKFKLIEGQGKITSFFNMK